MLSRLFFSVCVVIAVAIGTISLWTTLSRSNDAQIARIAEVESYAARSQLVRHTEVLHSRLHSVRTFWAANEALPADEWSTDDILDPANLSGIRYLLWDDPEQGHRFLWSPAIDQLDYRPTDSEWAAYSSTAEAARNAEAPDVVGPYRRDDGRLYWEVLIPASEGITGKLIAIIDVRAALAAMLENESPGYAIGVYLGDSLLYERGEPVLQGPSEWTRSGTIRTSLGTLLRVEHRPTAELIATLDSPSIDLILLLGLLISVLVGTLIYENGRARSRALAAEQAEARVANLNRTLEETVERRTLQLRERTRDLETLADSVAHDLRNPLNNIAVNAQLLEARAGAELGPESSEVLQRFTPSVNQMASILDRLLGLSEVTHATFEREALDMQALAREISEDLRGAEPPPPIDFRVDEIPDALADETLVHMLLTNLLGNAIKFTRSCDVREIRVGAYADGGETVYFVRDNGCGFDQAQSEAIFGAFNRLRGAGRPGGVGLGLTIAQRVIERHEGRIWAEGEPGAGAVFYFTLGDAAPVGR